MSNRRPVAVALSAVVAMGALVAHPTESNAAAVTERVSLSATSTQGTGGSVDRIAMSADGRYVAFDATMTNLVTGDTNAVADVFVRDRVAATTVRVSVATDGSQSNGSSTAPSISADGRYVAFQSLASNLVTGDTNATTDVFVRDLQAGITTRVSVATGGTQGNGVSDQASIAGNGRVVAFRSTATNLAPNEIYSWSDIFARDLDALTTERVSNTDGGANANGNSQLPSTSYDGRYVSFDTYAFNINSQYGDANSARDVYRRDRQSATSARVSLPPTGEANADSSGSSISANGRFVAFESVATNLVTGDTNSVKDVFVRDITAASTARMSVSSTGVQGNNLSEQATISSSGRAVGFRTLATNLFTGDTNNQSDTVVRDRYLSVTTNGSVTSAGTLPNSASGRPVLSSDGRYVAFRSVGTNVVSGDTNGQADAFVRDRDLLATPDLLLTATDTSDPTQLGAETTLDFTTRNLGTAAATEVVLTVTLDPGTAFASAAAGCSETGGVVTCTIGSLAAGLSATRTITVVAADPGSFVTSGSVVAEETEVSTANNTAAESTNVVQPDLLLSGSLGPDPVVVSETLSAQFTVVNQGAGTAPDSTLDVVVTGDVAITAAIPGDGSCSIAAESVSCALGAILPGAAVTVDIDLVPNSTAPIAFEAMTATSGVDAMSANNEIGLGAGVVQPDLSVAVTDRADPVARLTLLEYEIVVTNHGDGVARSVSISNPVPASTTFAAVTTDVGSCGEADGVVDCALGDLAVGATATVVLGVVPNSIGTVTNEATVTTTGIEASLLDNTASATTTITNEPEPNLRVVVSDLADPVRVSEPMLVQIAVDNLGTASATGVELDVSLPAPYVSAVASQGACVLVDVTLECDLAMLAPGAGVVVDVELDPDLETLLTTAAVVTSVETDFDPSDNNATETTLIGEPRLALAASTDPSDTLLGSVRTAVLTVTNGGTAPADGVTLTLTPPAGAVQSMTSAAGTCELATVTCTLGTLAPGAAPEVEFVMFPEATGAQSIDGAVAATQVESDTTDNTASAAFTVIAPDLVVTASDAPDPVDLGQSITVSATVANTGTAAASSVTAAVPIPSNGTITAITAPVGTCSVNGDGSALCTLDDLAVGAVIPMTVTVSPLAKGTTAVLVVGATTGVQPDVDNDAAATSTLVRAPDLVVSIVDTVDPRAVGQNIWYTATVRNDGDIAATGVQLAMALPAGTTFGSAFWSGGPCPSDGADARCTMGTISPGQTVTATLGVVAVTEGTTTTQAVATSTNVDANLANNTEGETTKVTLLSEFPDNTYQTNGKVDAIVYSGNVVYLAGSFTSVRPKGAALGVNEVARNGLAAFDVTTGAVLPWNPAPNGLVNAIAVSDDGATVYVGGLFTSIGGQTRLRLAALSAATGSATGWNPAPDGEVRALALAPGGVIYVGGFFGVVAGQPRRKLAAVSTATGAAVAGWDPVFTYPNKENLNVVAALAVEPDGSAVYAGGLFQYVDGVFHNSVVKLDGATGSVVDPWNPGLEVKNNRFETNVYELVVSGTKLFVCGDWYRVGGVISPNLVAVDTVLGSKRTDWIATTDGAVNACTVSGRRLYIGGHFDRAGGANADGRQNPSPTGAPRQHIAALDLVDGALDAWNPGADSVEGVYALDAAGNKLGVGGVFAKIGNWTAQQGFGQFNGTP